MSANNTISIGLDVSEVEKGADKAKVSLRGISKAAVDSGRAASDGAAKIGEGYKKAGDEVDKAAKKQERATQSIIRSVEREVAARQAGGRNTAEYFETLAKQRGADVGAVQKVTAALKAQNAQLKLNNITIGQYQNAMRMVPAQMTDVVTQLAGGQNPLLIALQQGGQMRDSFGGFGNMFKGLAASINPTVLAIGAAAGGVLALGKAFYDGQKEANAFKAAVIFAGNSAGVTADKLMAVASAAGQSTGHYDEARKAVLMFVESGKVAADDFGRFTESIVLQSAATGKSVEDLAQKYIDIANDPLAAVVKLSGAYQSMTADVYAQAQALIKQGKEQEAVALVQGKYADESKAMAERVLQNLGFIEKGWMNIKSAAADAWESMKAIGRDSSLVEKLAAAESELTRMKSGVRQSVGIGGLFGAGGAVVDTGNQAAIAAKEREVDLLKKQIKMADDAQKQAAKIAKERQESVSAAKSFGDLEERQLSKAQKFKQEELKYERELQALRKGGSAAQIANAEKAVRLLKQQHAAELKADAERGAKKDKKKSAKSSNKDEVYVMPYSGNYRITSGIGPRNTGIPGASTNHKGVDIALPIGTPVRAMAGGVVSNRTQKDNKGFGKYVVIQFDNGMVQKLGHLSQHLLPDGARVKAGDVVGLSGDTGVGRAHLHNEIRDKNNKPVDFRSLVGKKTGSKEELEVGRKLLDLEAAKNKEYERSQEAYKKFLGSKNEAIALIGVESEAEKLRIRMELGAYSELTAAQRQAMIEAAQREEYEKAMYSDKTKEMEAAAAKQQKYNELVDSITGASKIQEYQDSLLMLNRALDAGQISQEQFNLAVSKLQMPEQMRNPDDWLGGLKAAMQDYIGTTDTMFNQMADFGQNAFSQMGDELANFVATGKADFRGMTVSILQDLSKMLVKMAIVNAMKSALGGFAQGGAVQAFAGGGAVWGAGTGTSDSIPALLSNGEFVINAAATSRHRALLEAINSNRYASGGAVGASSIPSASLGAVYGAAGGSHTEINITVNRDGGASADTKSDAKDAEALGSMIVGTVERWYLNNVQRPGGKYAAR